MNKVLFFANLKDIVGQETLQLDLKDKTVAQVKELLLKQYPTLPLNNCMTAVNEEFAMDTDIIKENEEVAFIPPVSGG